MAINHNALDKARKAKRMERLFKGVDVTIPVDVNGRTVQITSESIADSCARQKNEHFEEFVVSLSAEEVIQKAYQIVNFQRYHETRKQRAERMSIQPQEPAEESHIPVPVRKW